MSAPVKPWLLLSIAIFPAVLPVLVERLGSEISEYFRRQRIAKRKAVEAENKASEQIQEIEAEAEEAEPEEKKKQKQKKKKKKKENVGGATSDSLQLTEEKEE